MKIRGQLGRASRMLSSLRHENEGLKKDNDELNEKLESCDIGNTIFEIHFHWFC